MGWWGHEDVNELREEEREYRLGHFRGEAVEGDDEGVVGGVGIVSLGFFWSGIDRVADEPREEVPGLIVVGEDWWSFDVDKFLVGEGSISKNSYMKSSRDNEFFFYVK